MKLSLLAFIGCVSSVMGHNPSPVVLPDYVPPVNRKHGMENPNLPYGYDMTNLIDTELGKEYLEPLVEELHPIVEQIFGEGIQFNPWGQNLLRSTLRFRTGIIVWLYGLEILLWTGKVQPFYDYTQW